MFFVKIAQTLHVQESELSKRRNLNLPIFFIAKTFCARQVFKVFFIIRKTLTG